jgi:hypothetical protein
MLSSPTDGWRRTARRLDVLDWFSGLMKVLPSASVGRARRELGPHPAEAVRHQLDPDGTAGLALRVLLRPA